MENVLIIMLIQQMNVDHGFGVDLVGEKVIKRNTSEKEFQKYIERSKMIYNDEQRQSRNDGAVGRVGRIKRSLEVENSNRSSNKRYSHSDCYDQISSLLLSCNGASPLLVRPSFSFSSLTSSRLRFFRNPPRLGVLFS